MVIKKYTVYWVDLDSDEDLRTRPRRMHPCVAVSPDELNLHLQTVMVAPLTPVRNNYPWRPACTIKGKRNLIALDQIRTVNKESVNTAYGRLSKADMNRMQKTLNEMFL